MDTSGQNHFDYQSLYFYKNILSIFLKYNLLCKQLGPGSSLKVSCVLKISGLKVAFQDVMISRVQFVPSAPFLYPLKISENLTVF